MMSRLLLAGAFLASSLFTSSTAGLMDSIGELVNPGFEHCTQSQSVSNWLIPDDWVQSGVGTETAPTVRCVTDRKHTGTYSAQFVPQSVNNNEWDHTKPLYVAEIYQPVHLVEAGQLITLSYWVFFGAVPEGADPSPQGQYNFTVYYDDEHNSVQLTPTYVSGSSTAANNYFYRYTASWYAPDHRDHTDSYITLTFSSWISSVYIYLDDVTLTAPQISGDPQFVGLRGQNYQVHGIDGAVYNLVSSPTTQVNAQFTFLNQGKCPIFDGIPASNCWAHPGSYLGAIGVQQIVGDKVHQLKIVSGDASTGFAALELNGVQMTVGDKFTDTDAFSVTFITPYQVTVDTAEFSFTFENSDRFINQAVSARVPLSQMKAHGLFGQTHQRKVYQSAVKYIAGDVDDYLISEHDVFGSEFLYNKFQNL